jgi:hypothetical protein
MKIQKRSIFIYIFIELVVLSIVLTLLYFNYVTNIERESIKLNTEILVNHGVDLFTLCTAAAPRTAKEQLAKQLLNLLEKAPRGEASHDADIQKHNAAIKAKTMQIIIASSITLFFVVLALWYFKVVTLELSKIIQFTIVGVAVLFIVEFFTIHFILTRYNPLDMNEFVRIAGQEMKKANAKYTPSG